MLAAFLGFIGVLVGAVLTHLFAISNEWRSRRMEAMVATVGASIRALGAHEGVYNLFLSGSAPPLTDDRAVRALTERNEAFTEWRIARAQLEILIPDDERLKQAVDRFNSIHAAGDSWVSSYLKEGTKFNFASVADTEHEIWVEMRAARHEIITRCQIRSRQDAHWRERIRATFSNR